MRDAEALVLDLAVVLVLGEGSTDGWAPGTSDGQN
jgi:hypothetical protein